MLTEAEVLDLITTNRADGKKVVNWSVIHHQDGDLLFVVYEEPGMTSTFTRWEVYMRDGEGWFPRGGGPAGRREGGGRLV